MKLCCWKETDVFHASVRNEIHLRTDEQVCTGTDVVACRLGFDWTWSTCSGGSPKSAVSQMLADMNFAQLFDRCNADKRRRCLSRNSRYVTVLLLCGERCNAARLNGLADGDGICAAAESMAEASNLGK